MAPSSLVKTLQPRRWRALVTFGEGCFGASRDAETKAVVVEENGALRGPSRSSSNEGARFRRLP